MIRVSAFPTVEWLRSRSADRPPISARRTAREEGAAEKRLLARWLQECTAESTIVRRNVWIATPDGERHVNLVLEKDGRRVGLRFGGRYERDPDVDDSVTLVYGRFDVMYRIGRRCSRQGLRDVVYALVCEKPTWFSAAGRIAAGRGASLDALVRLNAERTPVPGENLLLSTGDVSLGRLRLSRANEWVRAFERALSGPGGGKVH